MRGNGTKLEWEYAQLFDVESRTPLENWWQEQPSSIAVGRMGYKTKTIKSGKQMEVEIYPIFGRTQEQKARKEKQKISTEAMARHNLEAARRHLVRLANCNFTEKDLHVTLTYSGQTPTFEQAQKDVRNFLRAIKRRRKKQGLPEAKYIYTIEDGENDEEKRIHWHMFSIKRRRENGEEKRIHCHMFLSGGISREEIEKLWAKGYANCDRLQPGEEGLAALARYITKSAKNRKKWCCSKNLKKPKVHTSDVKMSNRRVKLIARGLEAEAKEIMRKAWPGWEYTGLTVRYSDRIDGVYIRGKMRKVA